MSPEDLARSIGEAFGTVGAGTITASVEDGDLAVTVSWVDDAGKFAGSAQQVVSDFAAAALASGDERVRMFLAATAAWLRGRIDGGVSFDQVLPHDLFVIGVLADPDLTTAEAMLAALSDQARAETYIARDGVAQVIAEVGAVDDATADALYALTPEGRATRGFPAAVAALDSLVASGHVAALIAMMEHWADEEYDPFDVAWDEGPEVTTLLLTAAWRALDQLLTDQAMRRRALDSFERLDRPATEEELRRAGW